MRLQLKFIAYMCFVLLLTCFELQEVQAADQQSSRIEHSLQDRKNGLAGKLGGLDHEITSLMEALKVPGAAVGVIAEGKTIWAKGYGLRELGKEVAVDADTIFAIASISKSFTASLMAMLVDEGKLDWNRPVREYISWFQMYDPVATQLMTPRDLVTHRSGLPSHDFIRFSTYHSPEQLVRSIRYLEPNKSFRDTFQYNNLMFATAGYLSSFLCNKKWEDLVQERIFDPLSMTNSTCTVEKSQKSTNYAMPHLTKNGIVQRCEFFDYQKFGVAPAGAVNSTVNDMLKYMDMQLQDGTVKSKRLLSEAQIKELRNPVMVTSPSVKGHSDYALAWFVTQHRNFVAINHSGSINGFTSQLILIPEKKIGIIVLNNLDSILPKTLGWTIADKLMGLEPLDYKVLFQKESNVSKIAEHNQAELIKKNQKTGTKPSLPLSEYCGEYTHPAYGSIQVLQDDKNLSLIFDAFNVQLKHYHHDSFRAESEGLDGLVHFRLGKDRAVSDMLLPLESQVHDFVFKHSDRTRIISPGK